MLAYGLDFYTPQTLLINDGRRIMIAWMLFDEQFDNVIQSGQKGISVISEILILRTKQTKNNARQEQFIIIKLHKKSARGNT